MNGHVTGSGVIISAKKKVLFRTYEGKRSLKRKRHR
jgi:hypothetical protein